MRVFLLAALAASAAALQSAGQCGASCKVNTDCDSTAASVCGLCMPTKSGFRCASGCGMQCDKHSDCGDVNCGYCNPTTKQCRGGPAPTPAPTPVPTTVGCGHNCVVNTDCSGECQLCFINNATKVGTCGTGCGMACTLDSHCLDSNCGSCNVTAGVCQRKPNATAAPVLQSVGQCGASCKVNTDCDSTAASVCGLCMPTKSGFRCASGCGMQCDKHSDCGDVNCGYCNPTTKQCRGGPAPTPAPTPVPTTVGCGHNCVVNTDCSGECQLCFINNATKVGTCGTGCGMACTLDSHCLDSNCGSCNVTAGVCQHKMNITWA